MKTQWSVIVALLFSLLVAVFALLNNEMIVVNYLFGTMEISAVLVILGSASAGALIIIFLNLVRNVKLGFELRELKKKIRELEKVLASTKETVVTAPCSLPEEEDTTEKENGQNEKEMEVPGSEV